MLKAKGIYKSFVELTILKGVDIEVKKKQLVSIVGPSGAGKTTLLQILGTLDTPDLGKGELSINGVDVLGLTSNALAQFRNEHLGFIFQFHQLLPEFTAVENIIIPSILGGGSKSVATEKAKQLLKVIQSYINKSA